MQARGSSRETCPISTEGWTRRVHFVREGKGGGGSTCSKSSRRSAATRRALSPPCGPRARAQSAAAACLGLVPGDRQKSKLQRFA